LSNSGKKLLEIKKIENPFPWIGIELKPKIQGKEYTITAVLSDKAPAGPMRGDIVLHTNNPEQARMKVPVCGLIES